MFGQELDSPGIGYSFKNFGKTAAILKKLSDQIILQPTFPTTPTYADREQMPDELVIEPGKPSATLGSMMKDTLTIRDAVAFQERKTAFWFYGYVIFDDAFGREHRFEYRYCYRRGFGGPRLEYYREFTKDAES
jgi:hypothetical protein